MLFEFNAKIHPEQPDHYPETPFNCYISFFHIQITAWCSNFEEYFESRMKNKFRTICFKFWNKKKINIVVYWCILNDFHSFSRLSLNIISIFLHFYDFVYFWQVFNTFSYNFSAFKHLKFFHAFFENFSRFLPKFWINYHNSQHFFANFEEFSAFLNVFKLIFIILNTF